MTGRRAVRALLAASAASGVAGCGSDEPTSVAAGATMTLTVAALPAIEPGTGGRYEAWVVDRDGTAHSLGPVNPGGVAPISFTTPIANPVSFLLTYEPRNDAAPTASEHHLLAGEFRDGRAALSVRGAVTAQGLALRDRPGQFTMFSPSNNFRSGYPSNEESGIWLFNMAPRETQQGDMWVRLTQLQAGWVYEGWMV